MVTKLDTGKETMTNTRKAEPNAAAARRKKRLRTALSDLLIVSGGACLIVGAALIWIPAACFVAGLELAAFGWLVGLRGGDAA